MALVLEFGSRSGSWFALGFFSVIFGVLGWVVAREIRLRSRGAHTAVGPVHGLGLFAVPVFLVYVSSVSGFYEAEVATETIRLHYLFPGVVSEVPAMQASARIAPAHKGLVRLIITAQDARYESTPWQRSSVADSLAQLNAHLGGRK